MLNLVFVFPIGDSIGSAIPDRGPPRPITILVAYLYRLQRKSPPPLLVSFDSGLTWLEGCLGGREGGIQLPLDLRLTWLEGCLEGRDWGIQIPPPALPSL